MSNICAVHPLRSLRPSLCICLGTTERTTAAGIQTWEPLDKMKGSCYDLDEFILSILKDSQDELRTACSMFLVGWTLNEWWSAMVPDSMKKSINFLWLMHTYWDTYWETLVWARFGYPLIPRRCQASFQFFHFLILRELIIHCGWRSKIANDSGSVAPCR